MTSVARAKQIQELSVVKVMTNLYNKKPTTATSIINMPKLVNYYQQTRRTR
jgi:hypothetical protein